MPASRRRARRCRFCGVGAAITLVRPGSSPAAELGEAPRPPGPSAAAFALKPALLPSRRSRVDRASAGSASPQGTRRRRWRRPSRSTGSGAGRSPRRGRPQECAHRPHSVVDQHVGARTRASATACRITAAKMLPAVMSRIITPTPEPNSARKRQASTSGSGPPASGTSTRAAVNSSVPPRPPARCRSGGRPRRRRPRRSGRRRPRRRGGRRAGRGRCRARASRTAQERPEDEVEQVDPCERDERGAHDRRTPDVARAGHDVAALARVGRRLGADRSGAGRRPRRGTRRRRRRARWARSRRARSRRRPAGRRRTRTRGCRGSASSPRCSARAARSTRTGRCRRPEEHGERADREGDARRAGSSSARRTPMPAGSSATSAARPRSVAIIVRRRCGRAGRPRHRHAARHRFGRSPAAVEVAHLGGPASSTSTPTSGIASSRDLVAEERDRMRREEQPEDAVLAQDRRDRPARAGGEPQPRTTASGEAIGTGPLRVAAIRRATCGDRKRGLRLGVGDDHGHALVGALAQRRLERHLAEQRHAEIARESGAAAAPERRRQLPAAGTRIGRHVLDHAEQRLTQLLEHGRGAACHPLRRRAAASSPRSPRQSA